MTCQVVLRIELEQLTYTSPEIELKYRVFQIYGQKHVTLQNPNLHPEPMSEIFVAKIPRNIAIENLFKFFAQCGEIYQMRLLMDFSGSNRGKCFVQYMHTKASREAICCLHDEVIESGHRIVVKMSLNNNQLFLRSIPETIPEEDIRQHIVSTIGEGLTNVLMKKSRAPDRYYCFCTYRDHQFAIMAHKKSWPFLRIGNNLIDVHWAIPELLRYHTCLYFTNFNTDITKKEFFEAIVKLIDVKTLIQFRIYDKCGFITFNNADSMKKAEELLKNLTIGKKKIKFSRRPFKANRSGHSKNTIHNTAPPTYQFFSGEPPVSSFPVNVSFCMPPMSTVPPTYNAPYIHNFRHY
ncbi:RNA-binding protein 47-like isoform X2 [Tribolium madens]|uniref:RNA-binding protein 47-like isoform X2 n=1 Tax=Tribolium madens TaxID=41895 RepID=UPI001CF735FA|nr:RNA-binding protein 47-like isoform X2 [Tribolium madens]